MEVTISDDFRMSTWNYRVMRYMINEHVLYKIVEVYYRDGQPWAYADGKNPVECVEEVSDLEFAIDKMKIALEKPILIDLGEGHSPRLVEVQ